MKEEKSKEEDRVVSEESQLEKIEKDYEGTSHSFIII